MYIIQQKCSSDRFRNSLSPHLWNIGLGEVASGHFCHFSKQTSRHAHPLHAMTGPLCVGDKVRWVRTSPSCFFWIQDYIFRVYNQAQDCLTKCAVIPNFNQHYVSPLYDAFYTLSSSVAIQIRYKDITFPMWLDKELYEP